MTVWYALRTDIHRELAVAQAILDAGHDIQCPTEVRVIQARRSNHRHRRITRPVLTGWVFTVAPEAVHGDFHKIRGYIATARARDAASEALKIDHRAMSAFLEHVAAHNARMERYYRLLTEGKAAKKPKITLRGFDGLDEALQRMQQSLTNQ